MKIAVDSREKPKAIIQILKHFEENKIKYFVNKLPVGDYMDFDNPKISIDRKQTLGEIAKNVCQDHARFRAELIRANDLEIQLVLLIEHSRNIQTLSDVRKWVNPRLNVSPQAMTGWALYDRLCTIKHKYNVPIYFCEKRQTGQKIIEILTHGAPYTVHIKTGQKERE